MNLEQLRQDAREAVARAEQIASEAGRVEVDVTVAERLLVNVRALAAGVDELVARVRALEAPPALDWTEAEAEALGFPKDRRTGAGIIIPDSAIAAEVGKARRAAANDIRERLAHVEAQVEALDAELLAAALDGIPVDRSGIRGIPPFMEAPQAAAAIRRRALGEASSLCRRRAMTCESATPEGFAIAEAQRQVCTVLADEIDRLARAPEVTDA